MGFAMDHLAAIRAFQCIVEARSFTKAAAQLGMPRSTVSKALQDLEAHLGTKLVQRTTRSVAPTLEGAEYYRRTSRLVSGLDEADEVLRGVAAAAKGRLRVEIHSSMANFVVVPAIGEFRARYPDIQLAIGISDRPVNLLEEGVDCAIRAGALLDPSLIARTIFKDQLVTCASSGYLERYGMPRSPADLEAHHQLVGYFSALTGEVWPMQFRGKGGEHQITRFDVASNDSAGQIGMMVSGLGVGQTYASVARHLAQSSALVPILEDWTVGSMPISVVYPQARRLNARVRAFVEWVRECLSRNPTSAFPTSAPSNL